MTYRRFLIESALLVLALAALCTVPVRVIWSRGPWLGVVVVGVSVAVTLLVLVYAVTAYLGWREERDENERWRRR